jgi:PhzF family phenazine biosynthesis protein
MTIPLFHVDAFTEQPFRGNPAAVCILSAPKDDAWLQAVGAEMNLSETAFLTKTDDGFRLRWFTPLVEVALCGHATLASAHVLWQAGYARPNDVIRFHTQSGVLKASRSGDDIELDFPLLVEEPAPPPDQLARALGTSFCYVGRNRMDYLVEIESEEALRKLRPDFGLLGTLPVHRVVVTSRSTDPAFDFVSRFFAPALGINEDPVTGAAHCRLASFWRSRLQKESFRAYQASARGGVVRVRIAGDRALLGGRAVTVARGELLA